MIHKVHVPSLFALALSCVTASLPIGCDSAAPAAPAAKNPSGDADSSVAGSESNPQPGAARDDGGGAIGRVDSGDAVDAGGAAEGGDAGSYRPFVPGTFSAEHEADVRKDCNETLQCYAQMEQELPENPVEQCLQDSAAALDHGRPERQQAFLTKLDRCRDLIVCDYFTCVTSR